MANDDLPRSLSLRLDELDPAQFDSHLMRYLSSMEGQFLDGEAYREALAEEDRLLYEVLELRRPKSSGELLSGISILHPGRIGEEYQMTKGHFHQVLETAEIYWCLAGEGVMVMETPEGTAAVEELSAGRMLYVPPRWAHRSVNTSETVDLVTCFAYPAHAGHDYGTIETRGFRKLVVDRGRGPEIIDNPRWGGTQAP